MVHTRLAFVQIVDKAPSLEPTQAPLGYRLVA